MVECDNYLRCVMMFSKPLEADLPRDLVGMRTSALGITFVNNQPRVIVLLLCISNLCRAAGTDVHSKQYTLTTNLNVTIASRPPR